MLLIFLGSLTKKKYKGTVRQTEGKKEGWKDGVNQYKPKRSEAGV